jgi:DNA helicase-2/ATP-dependent DNA helicase PcrA
VPSRFLSEIPQDLVQGEIPGGARASSRSGGDYGIDYSYAQDEPGESGGGLAAGLRVRHPIFGEGTVMQVSGAGQGQKLRIRFDKVGVKTVLLRFANLEVV